MGNIIKVSCSLLRLSLHSIAAWVSVIYERLILRQQHPLGWPIDLEIISNGFKACLKHVDYENFHDFRPLLGLLPKIQLYPRLSITPVSAGGCQAYWVGLKTAMLPVNCPQVVMFYVHGGGFVAGDALMCARSFHHWMNKLAQQGIHSKVLCVEYPLAPEHPFPAAVVEVAAAYTWLTQQVQDRHAAVIPVGDSAGANIVTATLAALRDLQQQQQQPPHTSTTTTTTTSRASSAESADVSVLVSDSESSALLKDLQLPRDDDGDEAEAEITAAAVLDMFDKIRSRLVGVAGAESSHRHHDHNIHPSHQQQATFRPPDGVVLVSPAVDVSHSACFYDVQWISTHEERYDYLPHEMIGSGMDHYASHPSLLQLPYLSPVNMQDFTGLVKGPWLILSGTAELLSQDINRFADCVRTSLGASGVHHHPEPHMPHSWAILPTYSMWPKQQVVVDYIAQRALAATL